MSRRARRVCVVLTLAFFLSIVIPQTSMAKQNLLEIEKSAPQKGQGELYWLSTRDPKEAREKIKQLRQGKSPEELGVKPARQFSPREQTLEQMEKEVEAAKTKRTYPVHLPLVKADGANAEVGAQAWNPPPFSYDFVQFEECVNKDNVGATGWIKNHYAYCWSDYAYYTACPYPSCDYVQFRFTLIGYGSNGQRTVSYKYFIDNIFATRPSWANGTKVTVEIQCDGVSDTLDCRSETNSPDTRPLAKWKNHNQGSAVFTSEPPPYSETNRDRVSYMDIWPRVTIVPPGPPTIIVPGVMDGPKEKIRADSARYMFVFWPRFYRSQGAIFANVMPTFYYDMNDPYFDVMKEAFQHHKDALTAPGSIVPGLRPKPPLTRLYPRYDSEAHNANIRAKERACSQLTKPGDGYECDEFPFATTYEGAAQGAGKFSVRYIPTEANNTHGRWLGAWYAYDRILHRDQFYIGFHE